MQDGSKQVITRRDPFEWPSKQNFYTVEHFDADGNMISETSSWHDMGNDYDYTSINWPEGSNLTMSMDPTGYRTAGFTTPDGRREALPAELIDQMSLGTTSVMSGLEKHLARGVVVLGRGAIVTTVALFGISSFPITTIVSLWLVALGRTTLAASQDSTGTTLLPDRAYGWAI